MSESLVVYLPGDPGERFLSALRAELAASVELVRESDRDHRILVRGVVGPEDLAASTRAVIIPYAGVPKRTRETLADRPDIALHNLHHNAAPTAETAVALLLAAARRIVPIDRAMRELDWRPRYDEGSRDPLLSGKRALVLGFGEIGRRVAVACEALGMEVTAIRRGESGSLPDLLPRAHAVVVCLPLTPETEGILGAEQLARLPDQAVVVNVGRGPIIDEQALYEELRAGRLRAGLDVWYQYPTDESSRAATQPSRFPYHELENVVLSPHRAGHCAETEQLRATHLAAMLNAAARGEEMPFRVDPERGY